MSVRPQQYMCAADVLLPPGHSLSRQGVMGSSTYLSDFNGQPYQFLLYLPFGETFVEQNVAGWATPYQFNGKEEDENTGLYYYGARYYDPRISLWHGVDPLAQKYPGHSPFNYVLNNPIRLIDPTGMSPEEGGEGDPPGFKLTNVFSNTFYGSIVILPLDLKDHNGAMQQRYDEAIKLGLPIVQVSDLKSLKSAFDVLNDQKTTANTFVFVGHGSNGFMRIGNEGIHGKDAPSFEPLKETLKGKNCLFLHCNVAKSIEGQQLLSKFAGETKTITTMSTHIGWSMYDLNGKDNMSINFSTSFPFFELDYGEGGNANNFYRSTFGKSARPVFDVKIYYGTGGVSASTKDRKP